MNELRNSKLSTEEGWTQAGHLSISQAAPGCRDSFPAADDIWKAAIINVDFGTLVSVSRTTHLISKL